MAKSMKKRMPDTGADGQEGAAALAVAAGKKPGAKKTATKKAGLKKAGAKKAAAKKAGVKKAGVKKLGTKKLGAKKSAALSAPAMPPAPPLAVGTSPAVLDRLWSVVSDRRAADPTVSHSARLFRLIEVLRRSS